MPNATKTMLDASEVTKLLDAEYPQPLELGERRDRIEAVGALRRDRIEAVGALSGRLRLIYSPRHRRPGGTIVGPSMLRLGDLALYATILAQNCCAAGRRDGMTIDFLRKPEPRDRLAECRSMKFRNRLVFGTVRLTCERLAAPLARASGTYSVPPRPSGTMLPLPSNT
jgi:acyl-coenzyme A thioesterase PaaI-like protein